MKSEGRDLDHASTRHGTPKTARKSPAAKEKGWNRASEGISPADTLTLALRLPEL